MGVLRVRVSLLLPGIWVIALLSATVWAGTDDSPTKSKSSGKSKPKQELAQKYLRPTDPSLYVGTDTCKTCHEDMPTKGFYKNFEATPHFVTTLDTKRTAIRPAKSTAISGGRRICRTMWDARIATARTTQKKARC
jgi:hypothetical protein